MEDEIDIFVSDVGNKFWYYKNTPFYNPDRISKTGWPGKYLDYRDGILHRLDGPAVIWVHNSYREYYILGNQYHNFLEYIQAAVKYKKEIKE